MLKQLHVVQHAPYLVIHRAFGVEGIQAVQYGFIQPPFGDGEAPHERLSGELAVQDGDVIRGHGRNGIKQKLVDTLIA
ncbi:MAG TPA: hypothetical protein PLL18_13815, partial [Flavobacteriales bacterium]|nr:hypothetical protein [Flavobacteriales bacterium]